MRPADDIERLIKKMNAIPSAEMDKRALNDIFEAQETAKKTISASLQPNIWRIIMKRPITKLATAAAIIIVVVISVTFLDKTVTPAWAIEQIKSS